MEDQPPPGKRARQQLLPASECRLDRIYLTDALSFLNHFWLQRCQLVSRHCNGTVAEGRVRGGRLRVREQFAYFKLETNDWTPTDSEFPDCAEGGTSPDYFTEEGFGDVKSRNGRDWRTVREYNHCCGDWLSTAAPPIAGQRIFIESSPNVEVEFSFGRARGGSSGGTMRIALILRNQLSTASATTLLHFAYHVGEELCFGYLDSLLESESEDSADLFNPAILSALASRRGGETAWIRAGTLVNDRVQSSSKAIAHAFAFGRRQDPLRGVLVLGCFEIDLDRYFSYTSPENLANFNRFLTHFGKCVPGREVTLKDHRNVLHEPRALIEPVVKMFREMPHSRDAVRRVVIQFGDWNPVTADATLQLFSVDDDPQSQEGADGLGNGSYRYLLPSSELGNNGVGVTVQTSVEERRKEKREIIREVEIYLVD